MLVAMVVIAAGSGSSNGKESLGHLPAPPWAFGLVAFGIIVVLLAVTYAFRSVGKRH
jgi:hypothetical protein